MAERKIFYSHKRNILIIFKYFMKNTNYLTSEEQKVIIDKGTEKPFSGEYDDFYGEGIYLCRRCNASLYESKNKFDAHCGWPSFDEEIPGAVKNTPDPDGMRTEVSCVNCGAHLGHIFTGEQFTPKNVRHCVNSVSLRFIPKSKINKDGTKTAVFGGGCFWCMEAVFVRIKGVVSVVSGYAGGNKKNPTYDEVSGGETGHAETVKIEYDPKIISYDDLLTILFYAHDPTSLNRQGNDIGEQYRSIILYVDADQKEAAEKFIAELEKSKAYDKPIVTEIKPLIDFYDAEEYHQKYFEKNPHQPYCQIVIAPKMESLKKRFEKLLK